MTKLATLYADDLLTQPTGNVLLETDAPMLPSIIAVGSDLYQAARIGTGIGSPGEYVNAYSKIRPSAVAPAGAVVPVADVPTVAIGA